MVFFNKNIWLRSFVALWFIECKLFVRQPTTAFFTFAFPILLFVFLGLSMGKQLWDVLNRYRRQGLTIVMTTHNMREAQQYSDVVCVVNRGQIVASGSVPQLLEKFHLNLKSRCRSESQSHSGLFWRNACRCQRPRHMHIRRR